MREQTLTRHLSASACAQVSLHQFFQLFLFRSVEFQYLFQLFHLYVRLVTAENSGSRDSLVQ